MISNQHYVELYVNNQLVELVSQESLNLRINNVLFNPTKTTTTQSEYSYSFDIPATTTNNKIFDYANNLSKLNKFHARYPSKVYADGMLIFDGSLTIQKYKDGMYTCNLVNIKVNSLEEIFGDEKLTDLKWMIDFDGAPTIDDVNYDVFNTKYFFPLVSYGVFQKDYISADSVGANYSPKNQIDSYNNWWIESFYPSLNVVETIRKAFESKGYDVIGSAFSDPFINNIYASCNLAQEQVPIYNLGNPKFGHLSLSMTWDNYSSANQTARTPSETNPYAYTTAGLSQSLKFPYERVRPATNAINNNSSEEYNFDTIAVWNMMDSKGNASGVTVTTLGDSYIYDPNEQLIVIPASGWYKIDLYVHATLSGATQARTVKQWTNTFYEDDEFMKRDVVISGSNATFKSFLPLEIQLVRNYDNNIELIKGKHNVEYATGDPNQTEYHYEGGSYTSTSYTNKSEWQTEFPHQDSYACKNPTKANELLTSTQLTRNKLAEEYGGAVGYDENRNSTDGRSMSGGRNYGGSRKMSGNAAKYKTYGFMHDDGELMPYDQAVSESFICGFSTYGDGQTAVMRNGRSWSQLSTIKNNIFADVHGLSLYNIDGTGTTVLSTSYCANEYKDSPAHSESFSNDNMSGNISCCVYLEKNDRLELMAIQRDYEWQAYSTSAYCSIDITAMSQRSEAELRADSGWSYTSTTEFPTQLNLFNFTNNETKISDWITSIQKAFNLEIVQQGKTIELNTNKGVKKTINYAIDLDDRINSDEVEAEYISYPKTMAVKYKIDTDEYGFELTVPPEHINDEGDTWKKWGDSGYTVIQLNDDTYETSSQETQTNFSYTYYMDFDFYQIDSGGTSAQTPIDIRIPVIEKSEYMAEGYGYDEAMKHDGYSFTQRFWYRQQPSQETVWLSSILSDGSHESINLTYTSNSWLDFNLSYKNTEKSLVTEYFNVNPLLSSNYIKFGTYLTPQEFMDLKNGALCKVDSDLYYVSEIQNYDPSGFNQTTLKLIKKV